MGDQVTFALIMQTVGGVMLTGVTGACGYLFKTVMDLRTSHAALASQVEADKVSTNRAFGDLKDSINAMDEKLDRLIERRP